MSGQEVATARIALSNEINRIEKLVKEFMFQEAEENFPRIEKFYGDLMKLLNPNNKTHDNIRFNFRIRINMLSQSIENGLEKRDVGKKEDGNIALKCNWNDMNYKGICSEKAYDYNQALGGPWCLVSKCRQFVNLPVPPHNCCYESRAFIDCSFGAGWDHGPLGEPIYPRKIRSARRGKIAILTTQTPDSRERFVIGIFRIIKLVEDPGKETFLFGDKKTLLDDVLKYHIRFWDHHKNPNNPESQAWATGLFRYMADIAVFGILDEYITKKRANGEETNKAQSLLASLKDSQ